MDNVETLKKVSNAVTQEPVEITVDIDPVSWLHAKGQRFLPKIFPKQNVYKIYPIKMGTGYRISELVLTIDKNLFTSGNRIAANMEAISKHTDTLCKIIAHAINNREQPPSNRLIRTVKEQFTAESIFKVLMVVLNSMNLDSFIASIILVRGLNILDQKGASVKNVSETEVNPQTQGSQIAPGTLSEGLLSTSGLV